MTLIEALSDEVFHFLIAFFVIGIVSFAWWTTNINEQRHIRTVLLLERTIRHRFHRRLTNHTEAITISEGTSDPPAVSEEVTPTTELPPNTEQSPDTDKPPEASTSNNPSTPQVDDLVDGDNREEQSIINTMDADTCVVRQRRLAFYDNLRNETQNQEPTTSCSGIYEPAGVPSQATSSVETEDSPNNCEVGDTKNTEEGKSGLTIKLKYINDDIRIVEGSFTESLEDFKKRHFEQELSANKLIRLIFNGQVLQPDTQTLKHCGLFDNCVVHCLVHPKRQPPADATVVESRSEGYSFPNIGGDADRNRDWDLGNFLFAFISLMLLAAWYFRYVYAHLYTVTATVGLILITGIFTIVLVGMYFPDNENFPNPTIHIRERVSTTGSPPRQ
ncbi:unnamed protein product [Phaedon cochleariae]|uniref:Ubiquitin-like domain-containing protein n=1 Tax=Phaedon cochleariae TaxID=80249 RepID=A0A9P0GVU9_PHACE|nr:unnamed protein product [Phaedon cochleariae]